MNDTALFPWRAARDTGYVAPAGAAYTEIRAIDPATPPVIIDIAGNLENKKAFKLSDMASSVRYVYLQQPPDIKITIINDIVSDDEHLFVRALEGLFCFSPEGLYLYTMVVNETEKEPFGNSWLFRTISGCYGNIDLLNGRLMYRTHRDGSLREGTVEAHLNVFDVKELDAQMRFNVQSSELRESGVKPAYWRRLDPKNGMGGEFLWMDDHSLFINKEAGLISASLYGDTLCKFNNYVFPTIAREARRISFSSHIYRMDGNMMLHKKPNDTVFRVTPPNRLMPAYVMNWGDYKPDINQHAAGSALEGKLVLGGWLETPRYIFIDYTEGRDYPIRRREGKVKDHWAVYDKTAKTLTHHNRTIEQGGIENDIDPVGVPFWPKGINHNGEMYSIVFKNSIKRYIETGLFQNEKLQAVYDSMPESFFIMYVK
jgi:hypothetical protein